MITLPYTSTQMKHLIKLLKSPHRIAQTIQLLTLDHEYKADYSNRFSGGQVTYDATADVTRALDLTLFDPTRRISLDPVSPSSTSVYIADMIRVYYHVIEPGTNVRYNIPIFCGPLDAVERDDIFIYIKCLGKESLSLNNFWTAKTYKKNAKKTDVIFDIMRRLMGETKLNIPNLSARLPNDLALNSESIPWKTAKNLAAGMGYQLYYDGYGVCRMRRIPSTSTFTFDGTWLTSQPKQAYDLTGLVNQVQVIGGIPKKAKKAVTYTATAPTAHPLSPWKLGRGGVPRYYPKRIEDTNLKTVQACKDRAQRELSLGLLDSVNTTWDGLPIPLFDEQDIVKLIADDFTSSQRTSQFTLPLTISSASYGYNRNLRITRGGAWGVRRKR